MTRNTITSPLTPSEASQQLEAIKYLNTGVELLAKVLEAQGLGPDPLANQLFRQIATSNLANHIGQSMQPRNDHLRFMHQAGVLPNFDEILRHTLEHKAEAEVAVE